MEPDTNVNPPSASLRRARRIVFGIVRSTVVLAGLLIATLAYIGGLLPMVLQVALAAGAVWGSGTRLVAVFRGKLTLAPGAGRSSERLRPARLQAVNRALFWAAAGLMLIWIMPAALIGPEAYRGVVVGIAVLTVVDVVLALVPTGGAVRPAWNASRYWAGCSSG